MAETTETAPPTLKTLKHDGLSIAYRDEGEGPTVLLGHCSSASHREWLPLMQALKSDWRVVAPDFIGYGSSESWPVSRPFSLDGDVAILEALAGKGKDPIHLVGHSYGAALALEAATRLGSRVKSLSLVEPVSFHLLRQTHRPEWNEIEALGVKVLTAVARGDDRAAAGAFMRYWLGDLRWFLAPKRFKQAIAATIPKVALEFTVAIDATTSLADYAEIEAPTLLIVGGKTRKPAAAVVQMLQQAMPNAESVTLPGAGHMSPFTHQARVNQLILAQLAAHR
ncbi:alpha/beta hydrolase [Methyloligella sp. 2.7D]|uniref:alpha/beta fold hydrolase n=1 Tax=unclassified Methyloligella TaxID=2625955 RepID=UPI00157D43DB|nr:alpha/beta hydrolase [Methyloligella sp. GL2]QKP76879.1 alpha/beta hydrolase [Methyloligella sp. GL2]